MHECFGKRELSYPLRPFTHLYNLFQTHSYLWLNQRWNNNISLLGTFFQSHWMNSVYSKTTLILIWPHTDHPELMQLWVVKLNIYRCSVLARNASQKPWAGLSLTLFHHLGFGNASLFMLWPSANRSILTAEARRWQQSSSVRGGLTQLGPDNSLFPTSPPQEG